MSIEWDLAAKLYIESLTECWNRQASAIRSSLQAFAERIEAVKSVHDKLENGNDGDTHREKSEGSCDLSHDRDHRNSVQRGDPGPTKHRAKARKLSLAGTIHGIGHFDESQAALHCPCRKPCCDINCRCWSCWDSAFPSIAGGAAGAYRSMAASGFRAKSRGFGA